MSDAKRCDAGDVDYAKRCDACDVGDAKRCDGGDVGDAKRCEDGARSSHEIIDSSVTFPAFHNPYSFFLHHK